MSNDEILDAQDEVEFVLISDEENEEIDSSDETEATSEEITASDEEEAAVTAEDSETEASELV